MTDRDGGGLTLTMGCRGSPEIATSVAGFGRLARPLEPAELVEAVERLHREGLARLTSDAKGGW